MPAKTCNRSTTIQTLIFDRAKFRDTASAWEWAQGHGCEARKTDVKKNTIRVRQFAPEKCCASGGTITLRSGVQAYVCRKRGGRGDLGDAAASYGPTALVFAAGNAHAWIRQQQPSRWTVVVGGQRWGHGRTAAEAWAIGNRIADEWDHKYGTRLHRGGPDSDIAIYPPITGAGLSTGFGGFGNLGGLGVDVPEGLTLKEAARRHSEALEVFQRVAALGEQALRTRGGITWRHAFQAASAITGQKVTTRRQFDALFDTLTRATNDATAVYRKVAGIAEDDERSSTWW